MPESQWSVEYDEKAGTPMNWWLSTGRQEAYTGRFHGTFEEAVVAAAKRGAYWKTPVEVREDLTGVGVAPKDRFGAVWAKVTVPAGSSLR